MRPALTAVADGHEQRILAVLDHKPWSAEDGEPWVAAFPCSTDPNALVRAKLTVAPDVTVPLPPPSEHAPARRPRRGASRSASPRQGATKGHGRDTGRGSVSNHRNGHESRLKLEHAAALRSRDEAAFELQTVKRECERLRGEREEARIARDEAILERDRACAERDDAQRARNRMLAERDIARARIEELARRWERTAGLGTQRTLERDATAVERDRVARERDVALEETACIARERDAALEERDAALAERDGITQRLDAAVEPRGAATEKPTLVLTERELRRSKVRDVVAEGAPPMPRAQQPEPSREAIEAGYSPRRLAGAEPAGRPDDTADLWRVRLLVLSALLAAFVILVALLLTH
jgi:hypothetical protein